MPGPHNVTANNGLQAELDVFDAAPPPPPPGQMWRGLLVVAFLASLAGLGLLLSRYYTTARDLPASAVPLRLIPYADVPPVGANFFLAREVESWKQRKTLEMAKQAGIHWIKQEFPWESLEPRQKGEFIDPTSGQSSWSKFDSFVDEANALGLEIIARLDRPPAWTRKDNRYPQRPPDDFNDFGDFVDTFVQHYRGRIHYIQVWNEPNIFPEWGDQPVDPEAYTRLLRIAYQRAKAVDPNIVILSAPLAITLDSSPDHRNMNDLDYLEAMYRAGAQTTFDILSANAFGMDLPPDDPPDRNILNFRRVELQRETMLRHGDANKAVWLDEYGWNAAPETMPKNDLTWQRVTEKQQAAYTVEGIRYARTHWPWLGAINIWYFRQVGDIPPDRADYYFRLVDVDFIPRQSYVALQQAMPEWNIATPGNYQETSTPVEHSGAWQLHRTPEASGQLLLSSVTPGDVLTITFRGPALDLVAIRKADAGMMWVTLDHHPAAGFPRDEGGKAYINLFAPQTEWQAHIPLVRDAGPGIHKLTLVVSNERVPASHGLGADVDGFVVLPQRLPFPWRSAGILGTILALIGWLLWKDFQTAPSDKPPA